MQDFAGLIADLAHVDMRIGLEGDDDVGEFAHLPGDIGVRVERDGDRHGSADHGAQAAQQFAFAVLAEVGHHRAVQAEQDAVEFFAPGGSDQRVAQPVERSARHLAARTGRGTQHMLDLPAMRACHVEEAGKLGVGIAALLDGLRPGQEIAIPEGLLVGRMPREGVGLVIDLGGQDFETHRVLH